MIIDVIKSKGVTFRCNDCNTYFVWKPVAQGVCRVPLDKPKCDKPECVHYDSTMKKCPECGSFNITKIPVIVYKIIREIRR